MRFLCVLILLLPASVFGQTPDHVESTTLENGMKILVQEDHAIPNVALYLFFRVGSRDERPGITGISHFFEHMMFNGSQKFGPGEFDRQMEKSGGSNNAYTTRDATVYTDWFPPDALELMMDMESDRMAHMTFDPKIVESERGVVYSERRLSVDNSNIGALSEQVEAAAIIAHPYHWPVVGWPTDIEAWTLQDLEDYYKQGYAPNNCVMVVVGDTTPKTVFDLAQKYFGGIPAHETFAEPRTKEPPQRGERVVQLQKESELPLLMMDFHTPETKSPETPTIEVLKALLSSGNSSRLYARLVDGEQAALTVSAMDEPSLDPYLLEIAVQPRAGVDVEKVREFVLDELNKLQRAPVAEAELRKAKNQWLAEHYRGMKTSTGKANLLGTYELFYGGYQKLYEEPAEIEKVGAADIQRVAKKLFANDNRTVGILVPQLSTPAAKVSQ
jgi:zinc protease